MKNKTSLKRGFRAVLIREIKRMGSHSIYLWVLFILPLFSFFLFTEMFEQGKANDYSFAVFDADNSAFSRKLIRWIDATPEIEVTNNIHSLEEGKRMVEKSEIFGVLHIPKGVENAIYSGNAKPLAFYYSNENLSAGSNINLAVQKTIKTMSAGINMQKRLAQTEMYNQAYNNIQPIKIEAHALYNPYINYSYYLVTALLPVMLLMFVISATIFVIGSELKYSTAKDWYKISGESIIVALTGKLLPYSLIFIVEALFMNFILFNYISVPNNGSILIISIATVFFVYAYQAMGVLIISILPNMRLSLSLGAAYSSMAFSFAGLTFPTIAMDKFLQYASYLFPYTHYLRIYIGESVKGLDLRYSFYSFLALSIFITLPFFLTPRLRQFLTNSKFWGRI